MNVSQSVPSSIEGVSFQSLSSDEVKRISVKRITNPIALDSLLHPIPGGLHDLALGAFMDNPCATCNLNIHSCPGHFGHIEFPVFLYHCTFITQAFRLLRAQCAYCHKLKMPRVLVNLYWCKLRLISHGLLEQAQRVEDVGLAGGRSHSTHDAENESDDPEVSAENLISARRKYVRQQIKSSERCVEDLQDLQHTEATSHARKQVLGELYKDMLKAPRCTACNAFSPGYRKNKHISFFRKPLSEKQLQRNIQAGVKTLPNPLTKLVKMQQEQEAKLRRQQIRNRRNEQLDEGIADMEDSSRDEDIDAEIFDGISDDSEEANVEQLSATDDLNSGAGFVQDESRTQDRHKPTHEQTQGQTREKYINANEVHAALTHLFDLEQELFNEVYNSQQSGRERRSVSADMFFVKSLLVPPNKFRKEQKSTSSDITESQENEAYRRILANCDDLFLILEEIKGTEMTTRQTVRNYNDLQAAWLRLQDTVNWLIDSDTNPSPMAKLKDAGGVKQKLEKKEGIFRMNIMGKRVNFAARTVLSPDPNIETNEIGVPPEFATRLYYPEPVTERNFEDMKKAVINGHKHPGAVAIEDERGIITSLRTKSQDERLSLANSLMAPSFAGSVGTCNKKVHRHLVDGDFVLMNRQPTLHKPSIMAHRAKVLKGVRTFRMHYANCKTYNADFDGDEMNLHFPQNEMARCEAWLIADADNQYLSATAGKPLRGLVQDHISMGVWLSSLDTFFTREEYHNFIYAALRPEDGHVHHERIMTVDPAICKPKRYWTGKQLVTTILFNIKPNGREGLNMASKCGVPADRWHAGSEEGLLRVSASEVVTGTLDAKQIGASRDSLIHTVHETYGLATAGRLIGILGRLLTKMLNSKAFSCGVEDLVMTHQGESARTEQLKEADSLGVKVAASYVSLDEETTGPSDRTLVQRLEEVLRDDDKQAGLDGRVKNQASSLSSKITRACLPNGLRKSFPENQMQTMTSSGAKGSMVNANLISCNLGQQVLEGRRVPTMVSGKTLPAFKPFESNIRAGGYIADRFLTGIRPQEYYFHTMAGREGLIDTAVKTSRSGYLQRCLIKGLESLRVDYDNTVRDADGAIIQAIYGEDGLDITKCQKIADFSHIAKNFKSFWRELDVDNDFAASASNEAAKWNEKALKQASKVGIAAELEPALSRYAPLSFAGSTSEKFLASLKTYMKHNADGLLRPKNDKTAAGIARQRFEWLQYVNYLKSLVQPGEAVGVVAGQSLGEPSTQMTLNTFHLAGHSAKNVTLGIPRLREILMTASVNLKTPTMMLWPNPELSKEQVTHFAKSLTRVSLAQIIDQVRVTERLGAGVRSYDVSLQFFDASDYRDIHALTISHVAQCLERIFIPNLRRLAKADIKRRSTDKSLERVTDSDAVPEIGKSTGRIQEQPTQADADREADSDSEAGGDEDATTAKRRANMDEGQAYDDPDDEDEADLAAVSVSSSESEDETYSGSPKPKSGERLKASSSDQQEPEINGIEQHLIETAAKSAKARVQRILEANEEVSTFEFDESIGKECTITLEYPSTAAKVLFVPMIKKAARQSLAGQHVPGVESCMVMTTEEEDPKPYLFTQGENLVAMRSYQHFIVPHTMTSNDVGAVLRIYGVEAARETIAQELHSVFDGHSIDVDRRHLTLVADYMTRAGGFKAFSRTGMVDSVSPLQKMSFETTLGFLKDAIQEGEYDNLLTPSARITVGKPGRIGTGMFDLMVPVA